MSFVSANLVRVPTHLTRLIGTRWGDRLPIYFVTEYPKSGGAWLTQMLADALLLPAPQHYHLPVAFANVVQNHYLWTPRLRNVCYLYRDGRDGGDALIRLGYEPDRAWVHRSPPALTGPAPREPRPAPVARCAPA